MPLFGLRSQSLHFISMCCISIQTRDTAKSYISDVTWTRLHEVEITSKLLKKIIKFVEYNLYCMLESEPSGSTILI